MKTCEECGTKFTPKRREQRFCCALCSGRWVAAHRRKPKAGRPQTPETREKLRLSAKGRPVGDETRRRLSAARKGKPKPPEWREHISTALTGNPRVNNRGERNPNYRHGRYVGQRDHLKVVERERCAECGRDDCGLDTHHIDGDHGNNDEDNLIVLCDSCHGRKHGRPRRQERCA